MIKRLIFVAILGSFTVAGCSNSGENQKNTNEASEPETTKAVSGNEKASEGKAIHITKADFLELVMDYESNPQEWVYKGDKPCIIDFYADWCGPCKIASPVLDELAAEYKDDIYVYKVDTEVERELAGVFQIRSIPAFLFCPQEGKPTMSNGIARTPEDTKQMFIQMIDQILLGKETGESL